MRNRVMINDRKREMKNKERERTMEVVKNKVGIKH